MIPYERHEAIMNLLREKKYVRTEQLSKALYVSVATIRRDLTEMEKNGFLQRVSGGARVIEEPKDRPVEYMVEENVRKKKHIARLASRYLRDDQRISLDAGSTVLQLCPYFERYNNLNIDQWSLYGIGTDEDRFGKCPSAGRESEQDITGYKGNRHDVTDRNASQ